MNEQIEDYKQISKGRVWAKLEEILEKFESGGRPKGGVKNIKSGVPSIGGEHLTPDGRFNFEEIKYIPIEFFDEMTRGLIQKGDILIVKDGATTGKTSIIRADFPYEKAAVNEHVFIARPFKEIDNLYLFYYLYSPYGQDYVKKNFKGTAQGGINLTFAKETYIPLPPLSEQHRIVAKIEELFTKLDTGVEALKKIKAQLKRYRQAVLKYAFEGKLTEEWRKDQNSSTLPLELEDIGGFDDRYELPEGWVWARLDKVCIKIQDGSHFSPREQYQNLAKGKYLYITAKNIKETGIDLSDVTYIDESFHKGIYNRCNPEKGDVLLIKDGVKTGIAAINNLTEEFSMLSSVALFKTRSEILDSRFLKHFLNSPIGFRMTAGKMTGTAIKRIILDKLRISSVPLPSLPEQQQIVSEIERRLSVTDEIEKTVDASLKQSKRLRQSILKRAFEGKLVPQDPNDEPAEKLLERIKAEKAKMESEKTKSNKKTKLPRRPKASSQ